MNSLKCLFLFQTPKSWELRDYEDKQRFLENWICIRFKPQLVTGRSRWLKEIRYESREGALCLMLFVIVLCVVVLCA